MCHPPKFVGLAPTPAFRLSMLLRALIAAGVLFALPRSTHALTRAQAYEHALPRNSTPEKVLIAMSNEQANSTGAAEMAIAKTLTTKILAIGTWTAKATPETRPAIMPAEARDTMRLLLAGKIDQWFAKNDGSGAVFLMTVNDAAEAHSLLENLPLGRAKMMTFDLIPLGPLWPLGLLLNEPQK